MATSSFEVAHCRLPTWTVASKFHLLAVNSHGKENGLILKAMFLLMSMEGSCLGERGLVHGVLRSSRKP